MKPSHVLVMLAGSALVLHGQKTFSGPVSGYVFDSVEHSVRAVLGVPGAASLGSSSPPAWDSVSVAPNGKRAIGVIGVSVNLIPDLSQPASFTPILLVGGAIDRIRWSGDSTTAAVWSPAARQLLRITALDSVPAVHDPIDLTALAGVVSGLSVSPDGRYLALSSPASGAGSVYLSDRNAVPVPIGSVSDPGAAAFSEDGASLFVFSVAERRILILDSPSGADAGSFDASSFESTGGGAVGGAGNRELHPAGRRPNPAVVQDLAPSADGSRLYAIGGQTLCGYDLRTRQMLSCTDLDIIPASLQPIPGGILLLNYVRAGTMPLWLLDGKTGQTWFVPSGSAGANASF